MTQRQWYDIAPADALDTEAEGCQARAEHCRCVNGGACQGRHACDCGGSWSGDLDGSDFVIHALPGHTGHRAFTVQGGDQS